MIARSNPEKAGRVGEDARGGAADLFAPLTFSRGRPMRNRLALSPMTTQQSHPDGRVSDEELGWLTSRARGGFGMALTCASPVQSNGAGVDRLPGVYSDDHLEGLGVLAGALRGTGALGLVQVYHAGPRVDPRVVPEPVAASDGSGARALTLDEVQQLVSDFAAAAARVEKAGFDGVEVHGAHGYLLTQFLSAETNRRTDDYGGPLENRARLLLEVLRGIRVACGPDFQLGLRLSVERYGLRTLEMRDLVQELYATADLDYLDLSLWDVTKYSEDEDARHLPLLEMFAELPRGDVRLGVAGKVRTPAQAVAALERGADFAFIGRGAILHRDYAQLARDPGWEPAALPASTEHFVAQGISPRFLELLRTRWDNIVGP